MKYIEKHPMIMIVIGILGISLSAIFDMFVSTKSNSNSVGFISKIAVEEPTFNIRKIKKEERI